MAGLRSETAFSSEFRKVLGADKLLDVFQMETAIDDGLPDYGIVDRETGRITFLELKVGTVAKGDLLFPTLQGSQINFLAERSRSATALILIEHPAGLHLIPADYGIAWRRAMAAKRLPLGSPLGRPVEWSTLAQAMRAPLPCTPALPTAL